MTRFHQILLIATFLPLCWLGMMAVHELGHVLAAVLSGGRVSRVVLHPLAISRTDLAANPHPLWVAWSGPAMGVLLPLTVLGICRGMRLRWRYLVRFFAGVCLVANGAYLGAGSLEGVGDSGEMLRHGTPIWCLWLFGLVTLPLGLFLWHGLGADFGLGKRARPVDRGAAYLSGGLLVAALVLMEAFR